MKMNMDALKALELKLAEYSKANGAIAELNHATKTDAMRLIAQDRAGHLAQADANSDVVERDNVRRLAMSGHSKKRCG